MAPLTQSCSTSSKPKGRTQKPSLWRILSSAHILLGPRLSLRVREPIRAARANVLLRSRRRLVLDVVDTRNFTDICAG